MSERVRTVNQVIKSIAGGYLEENLPRDFGMVTITAVETTPDLKKALVWYSYIGTRFASMEKEILGSIKPINKLIVARMNSKNVPRVRFRQDFSGDYAQKISKLISESLDGSGGSHEINKK